MKKLRKAPCFVADECLGKSFATELNRLSEFEVKNYSEVWDDGENDPIVISKATNENLIILTLDARMRTEHRDVILRENARVIVFGAKKYNPKELAHWFAASEAKVLRFIRENDAPFFARFTQPSEKQIKDKLKPKGTITNTS